MFSRPRKAAKPKLTLAKATTTTTDEAMHTASNCRGREREHFEKIKIKATVLKSYS
jgi:hypothetical protein